MGSQYLKNKEICGCIDSCSNTEKALLMSKRNSPQDGVAVLKE